MISYSEQWHAQKNFAASILVCEILSFSARFAFHPMLEIRKGFIGTVLEFRDQIRSRVWYIPGVELECSVVQVKFPK